MKALLKLSALTLLFTLIFTGCEKDPLQPDKNALRISKIADNAAMEYPFSFIYNETNLIETIEKTQVIHAEIIYDSNDLPTEVFIEDHIDQNQHTSIIEWIDDGFIIGNKTYIVVNNRISKIYNIKNIGTSEADTSYYAEYMYYGDDSLTIEDRWSQPLKEIRKYKFGDTYNPVKDINIAIIAVLDLSFEGNDGSIDFGFGEYAIEKYVSRYGEVFTIEYDINDERFPVSADIQFSGRHEYMYYSYE